MTSTIAVLPKTIVQVKQSLSSKTTDKSDQSNSQFGKMLNKTAKGLDKQTAAGQASQPSGSVKGMDAAVLPESIQTMTNQIDALLQKLQKLMGKLGSSDNPKANDGLLENVKTLQSLLSKLKTVFGETSKHPSIPINDSQKKEDILADMSQWGGSIQPLIIKTIEALTKLSDSVTAGDDSITPPTIRQSDTKISAEMLQALNKAMTKTTDQLTTLLKNTSNKSNSDQTITLKSIPSVNTNIAEKVPQNTTNLLPDQMHKNLSTKSEMQDNHQSLTPAFFQSGPMNKIEQLSFHQPKQAATVNDQLIQKISDYLRENGLQTLKNGSQQMIIKLHPDHLGEVTITLTQDKNGIMAKIAASQSMTKDLIQSQLQQLNQGLQSQQISIQKIEVSQMIYSGQQQSPFYQQQESEQQQSQQQDQRKDDLPDDTTPSFEEWLAGEV